MIIIKANIFIELDFEDESPRTLLLELKKRITLIFYTQYFLLKTPLLVLIKFKSVNNFDNIKCKTHDYYNN